MTLTPTCAEAGDVVVTDAELDRLLLIRNFEQALLDLFGEGLLSGTTHTCLGQEQVPVAVSGLLTPADFVFSNHRGHGHYLARFDDPAGLLAEITGRAGAICNGVGGSQHIYRENYLSTGVQGESVPVAVGVALALQRTRPGAVALAYLGDGTWGEGSVYEALNIAVLRSAPVVLVVENNGIAQSTPVRHNLAGTIAGRVAGFGASYQHCAVTDVAQLQAEMEPALARVRSGGGPLVLECTVDRLGPHSKGDDTRDVDAVAELTRRGWYQRYEQALGSRFADAQARATARVAAVVSEVLARPASVWQQP